MATEVNNETLVNLKTALGSDTALPISGTVTSIPQTSATGTVTRKATSAANQTLLAANASRKGATIENNSQLTNLFVKLGATASITAGSESYTVRIPPNGYYEVPFNYTDIIDGISDGADAAGEALVTELT
jgi:hypothetical protein